jgi:ubiquinone/menaquinone biosynthesis C-methylase UbiE
MRSALPGHSVARAPAIPSSKEKRMATTEELHRRFYDIAEAIAPTWEQQRARIEEVATPVREWMLRALAPRSGDTVLELAAGSGDTGFEAARIVGADGRLICTDFSPTMLDAARRRGRELGLENVDYRVIDAQHIDLDEASVDGVLCRYGYMLMADPAAALAETRRVLRPGGRLALAVWGPPARNPFFTLVAASLTRRGHIDPPEPEGPGIFSMAASAPTAALLEHAGFDEIRTAEVPVRFTFEDVDEYLGFVGDTAGPLAIALRDLSQAQCDAVSAELAEACASFATDTGYALPGVSLAAVAHRATR